MTEEEKKSHYKSFGQVMRNTMERRGNGWIPITQTCMTCHEIRIRYAGIPWEYQPYVKTHCWKCKGQTKQTIEY